VITFSGKFFGSKTAKEKKERPKLRCEVCGNIQLYGDWEKAMDAQAKAMGSRGFVNIGAEPQCFKCGSGELRNLSHHVSIKEREPKFITDAAKEIVRIMEPYFKDNADLGKGTEERLVAIGKSLYDKGGHAAMLAAFKKARNLCAHRHFAYTGSNRHLEMIWDGIVEWRG